MTYRFFKRSLDIVAALAGLCLLSPLLLLIALVVLLGDGLPIFYTEKRLGRGERLFTLIKFRTLHNHSNATSHLATEGDPRITRPGRWLRRWRIDEFPALLNVLRGDMSLVGPRPMVAGDATHLTNEEREIIYSVRPGLTDRAAVEFLAEDAVLADVDEPQAMYIDKLFHPKMASTIDAIKLASFSRDLATVFMTARNLWSPAARARSRDMINRLLRETE